MKRAFRKGPRTVWRYIRLVGIVSSGSEGDSMIEGVSEAQHRELNESPLSDQSQAWVAFGNQPIYDGCYKMDCQERPGVTPLLHIKDVVS